MTLPLLKDVTLFLDEKPSVYAIRQKAKSVLEKTQFPTKKTESWKYTDISPILKQDFDLDTKEHSCHDNCCHHNDDSYYIEFSFCHGQLHIEDKKTPSGLTITPLPLVLYENEYKQYLLKSFDIEKHPFAALNTCYLEQGICIYVDKNTKITKPLVLKYNQSNCSQTQTSIHNLIILEKNAEIEIFEDFSSKNNNIYLNNIVNEFYIKENSTLTHYKQQKESQNAYHIALTSVKIHKNATYKQYSFSKGGKISRDETIINLTEQQANAEIYAAYNSKKDTLTDITTKINHLCSNTKSNQLIKGILDDDSTANFQGKIHITTNADKCEGNQLHKALFISDNATLNCKPELEIFSDDVKCSHGASCGEINKEQLFYLTSRGIDKKTAIELLTKAHLEEVLNLLPNEKIKEMISL